MLHINNLEASNSTGLEGLGPRMVKLAAHSLSTSVDLIINKNIATGQFSSQMKLAKVLPFYKIGGKSDPSNYRPKSILPTVSKIFEKHENKHLMAFFENKYYLYMTTYPGLGRNIVARPP